MAGETEGMVGADIEANRREAAISAMREFVENLPNQKPEKEDIDRFTIYAKHFEQALKKRNRWSPNNPAI